MKKSLLSITLITALCGTAHADTIYGLYADVNYWHTGASTTDDGRKDEFKDKGQLMLSASFEHGVPLIPNVRVRHADISTTDKRVASVKMDVNSTDAIAYYELLDNIVSVDVGLGAKRISGDVSVQGLSEYDLGKSMPIAYASVGAKLPFTGLSAKAEAAYGKGTDVSSQDMQAQIQYNFIDKALIDVGVKAGYRILSVDYKKMADASFGDVAPFKSEFKGPFVGVEVHF